MIETDLALAGSVSATCDLCEGRRYDASVLEHTFGGKDIAQVLAMSVAQALEFFTASESRVPAAQRILERLDDVGLGYLLVGQPLSTLSGGVPLWFSSSRQSD